MPGGTWLFVRHCELWEQGRGMKVSASTMSRTVRKLGWTYKQRLRVPLNGTKKPEVYGTRGQGASILEGSSSWTRAARTSDSDHCEPGRPRRAGLQQGATQPRQNTTTLLASRRPKVGAVRRGGGGDHEGGLSRPASCRSWRLR
jgi:hypothetical protein